MTEDMQQKPTKANIENEAKNGLKNVKYSLAMARTAAPHSASSQFLLMLMTINFRFSRSRWIGAIAFLVKSLQAKMLLIKLKKLKQ